MLEIKINTFSFTKCLYMYVKKCDRKFTKANKQFFTMMASSEMLPMNGDKTMAYCFLLCAGIILKETFRIFKAENII